MNKLTDLENIIKDKIPSGQETLIALMDIARFQQLEVGSTSPQVEYDVDIDEIYKLISKNLNAAIASPHPYIREWGKFISDRKKKK